MRRLRVGPRTPIAACEGLPLPRRRAPPRAGRGADRDLVVLPTRRPARLTDVSPRPCWAPRSRDARAGLLLRAALEAASPRPGCIAASRWTDYTPARRLIASGPPASLGVV